ncbi:hypothetical protein ACFFK7_14735 [Pseudoalteromonas xiamenensis]|uniref:hypothetical protein n=1 Tax=Pseudoalteromonas xiamenensis TaxID=882626 RepID=UPI0035EDC849
MPILLILGLLFTCSVHANSPYQNATSVGMIVKNEWHDSDTITGVGIEAMGYFNQSPFGFSVSSALGVADVRVKDRQRKESYATLDTGIKVGYFADVFVYGEVGLDLFEMLFYDLSRSHRVAYNDGFYLDTDDKPRNNSIDGYIGVGAGINVEPFKVEVFTRYRQIDSEDWEAQNSIFSGVQVSMMF